MTGASSGYAQALFELALEQGKEKEFYNALCDVRDAFLKQPEYVDMLACYGIPIKERTDSLSVVFSDALPEFVLSFLQLLCEHGNIKCFFDTVDEYENLYNEHLKVSKAVVKSAFELSGDQKSRLVKKLTGFCGHDISVEYTIDKSLVGGITVEIDGKVIDGSIKRRLNELKDVINK